MKIVAKASDTSYEQHKWSNPGELVLERSTWIEFDEQHMTNRSA